MRYWRTRREDVGAGAGERAKGHTLYCWVAVKLREAQYCSWYSATSAHSPHFLAMSQYQTATVMRSHMCPYVRPVAQTRGGNTRCHPPRPEQRLEELVQLCHAPLLPTVGPSPVPHPPHDQPPADDSFAPANSVPFALYVGRAECTYGKQPRGAAAWHCHRQVQSPSCRVAADWW